MRKWSDAEILRLKDLLKKGMSASQAGSRLGRSKNSVVGCISRCPTLREFYTPKVNQVAPQPWNEAEARSMLAEGWNYTEIGKRFALKGQVVHERLDPAYAETRRAGVRSPVTYRPHVSQRNYVRAVETDEEAYRQFANFPKDTRNLTARLFGDPLPGRSALDMRNASAG